MEMKGRKGGRNMKKFLFMALIAVMLVTVSACAGGGDGLQGTAAGHEGDITVEVEADDEGNITNVEVVEHSETDGISDPAIEQIPQAIVDANSTDVDAITDATVTSEAIMEAVDNALANQ